jgi:hypothetical protein
MHPERFYTIREIAQACQDALGRPVSRDKVRYLLQRVGAVPDVVVSNVAGYSGAVLRWVGDEISAEDSSDDRRGRQLEALRRHKGTLGPEEWAYRETPEDFPAGEELPSLAAPAPGFQDWGED